MLFCTGGYGYDDYSAGGYGDYGEDDYGDDGYGYGGDDGYGGNGYNDVSYTFYIISAFII